MNFKIINIQSNMLCSHISYLNLEVTIVDLPPSASLCKPVSTFERMNMNMKSKTLLTHYVTTDIIIL